MLPAFIRGWGRALRTGFVCVVAAVAVLCAPTPARAQVSFGAEMMPDLFTKRSFDGMTRILGFDADQKEAAKTLFDVTKDAQKAQTKDFQAKMQKIQSEAMEDGDWSAMRTELPAITEEFSKKQEALEKQFMDDLKSLCSESQANQWDRVERFRRRDVGMRFSFVSGAAADLCAIVDRTKSVPAGNTEFADTLLAYEMDIDKPLQVLMQMQKDQAKKQKEFMDKAATDPMKMMEDVNKMMAELNEQGRSMRSINREYARKLSEHMNEESRRKFEEEFNLRSFPRVYRTPHASKLFDAALAMSDLAPDQREQLLAVRQQYTRDLDTANVAWAKAIEEDEDKNNGAIGRMMMMAQGGGDGESPVKATRQSRRDLDKKTEDRIASILTEAQRDKLPEKKPAADNVWTDFMPGMDEIKDAEEE